MHSENNLTDQGSEIRKPWNIRQQSICRTAAENNLYYHQLLQQGVTEFSGLFDLSTQTGYDSDHVMPVGEEQKKGVAIDSLEDMEVLFNGISLQDISLTINAGATGFILLAFYIAMAKKRHIDLRKIKGTLQNDILSEYITGGRYIYPLQPSMRIFNDLVEWGSDEVPGWKLVSASGYHIREAGSSAVQEIAFTLSNAKAYMNAAIERGVDINSLGKRAVFFFNAHNNLFEEVAKFRAARKMWAQIMQELGATDEEAMVLRFHSQTHSNKITVQQPLNNISRVTIQALSAVLGGTLSMDTNGYGGALVGSGKEATTMALHSQQILAYETGVADTADPLAGSYVVEALTEEIEFKAMQLIKAVDAMGGSVAAIQQGYMQDEIRKNAEKHDQDLASGKKIIVGVNKFYFEHNNAVHNPTFDDSIPNQQIEKLSELRRRRDPAKCDSILQGLNDRAAGDENIMPAVVEAAENKCTLGEIADTLREVYGGSR